MSLPNYITVFRILLTPFFFTQLISYEPSQEWRRWAAFGFLLFACLTDALDGFLARLLHQKTRLGQFLDPLADKLLILSGYFGLLIVNSFTYQPPLWITVAIVFRDLVIVVGLILLFLMNGQVEVRPNLLGKITTFFQMITLCSILLNWKISIPLCYLTAVVTILSCLTYTLRDLRKLS